VAVFLPVLGFPLPLIPPTAPHSSSIIIRGWYNRPVVASLIVDCVLLSTKRKRNNKETRIRSILCRLLVKKTKLNSVASVRSELYRPNDHRLSAKLLPTLAVRRCHVVSVTDLYGRILGFLHRSRYFFFQVAPQLYSTRLSGPRSRPTTSQKIW
jgi:hypothetical protein